MTEAARPSSTAHDLLDALRATGAAQFDGTAWHFIEVLADRTRAQTGPTQSLLQAKLDKALVALQARMSQSQSEQAGTPTTPAVATPSPLAALLRDMAPHPAAAHQAPSTGWRPESPRIELFRQQLSKLSVQKQVTHAMAQAPQNAGPINSHMLVLRSLGLMRDASPDYINRFMTYLDSLLCLDEADKVKLTPKKAAAAAKSGKK
jgi:hypothetical protein